MKERKYLIDLTADEANKTGRGKISEKRLEQNWYCVLPSSKPKELLG